MIIDYKENFKPGDNLTILDFCAEWYGPCRVTSNNLAKFSDAHPEIPIIKVDVEQYYDVAEQYQIQNIPTIIGLENGEEIWRIVGLTTVKNLEEKYDSTRIN